MVTCAHNQLSRGYCHQFSKMENFRTVFSRKPRSTESQLFSTKRISKKWTSIIFQVSLNSYVFHHTHHTHSDTYIYIYTYRHIHVYIYIYRHIYIHTHIYIYYSILQQSSSIIHPTPLTPRLMQCVPAGLAFPTAPRATAAARRGTHCQRRRPRGEP